MNDATTPPRPCSSKGCARSSTIAIHWPHQVATPMCLPCATRARAIARVCGFGLDGSVLPGVDLVSAAIETVVETAKQLLSECAHDCVDVLGLEPAGSPVRPSLCVSWCSACGAVHVDGRWLAPAYAQLTTLPKRW